jgi:hypothetical protein
MNSASEPRERSSFASAWPTSPTGDDDFCAFLGEGDGGGASDARESPGDQDD